ncbi:MAG: hypothetical protein LC104_21620 [Bacteroidales bacterium]|nr:hypothetical protein [Bacteroidales bacterium]MCZ2344368.1 hypothetical protein [Bacteroidales bacterium]
MSKPKNDTSRLQAEAACENAHLITRNLLERIEQLLQDMPAPGDDDHPIHWGHVGDIHHINTLLTQVVHHLDGTGE